MRPQYKTTYKSEDIVFPTFEHVLSYIRKNPECMVTAVSKNSATVIYRKGCATLTSRMSAKRNKLMKSLFEVTDFRSVRTSKYQERLKVKRFKAKWMRMTNLERLSYEQRYVNKQRRYQTEWGGNPSSVSSLARKFRASLVQMGIKETMNASS